MLIVGPPLGIVLTRHCRNRKSARASQPVIHIHRQRQFLLPRCRNLPYKPRHPPRGKGLVRIVTENLPPRSQTGLLQTAKQLGRHLPFKLLLRNHPKISHCPQRTRLILHLHHDHSVLRIGLPQVTHQRYERFTVRRQIRRSIRTQHINRPSVPRLHPGKGHCVGLHPLRHIVHLAVLPCAEPQQHQPYLCSRACCTIASTTVKSNRPRSGSICSQYTGTSSVFSRIRSAAGHTVCNRSGHPLELSTCAPSTRNGLPSTISVARPCSCTRRGISSAIAAIARAPVPIKKPSSTNASNPSVKSANIQQTALYSGEPTLGNYFLIGTCADL